MTELNFKGKEFVFNHHLTVPHRPLMPHLDKGIGDVDLSGNLIIQGDNLHALKALLPMYAGKVDCIFIDPPYNTGTEGWRYNDNVNAPMIREWLDNNPIGVDDGLRHDKWCAMMWPRLRLLHELLADTGSFWMTLDDNEIHRGKLLLDEIFGQTNFVGDVIRKTKSTTNDAKSGFNIQHETCVIYAKIKDNLNLEGEEKDLSRYANPDNDPKGPWLSDNPSARTGEVRFPIENPYTGRVDYPPEGRCWGFSKTRYLEHVESGKIKFKKSHNANERGFIFKRYRDELRSNKHLVNSLFAAENDFMNQKATKEVIAIFGESVSDYPKPLRLLEKIVDYATNEDALILDSFAGSGTTAHAVLAANAEDNGNRKFILVEMEDDADTVTAERVRRVINGYENAGKATTGLGGNFTYCTLGDPIDMDRILTGDDLPAFDALGAILFHMATNQTLDTATIRVDDYYLGATETEHVWMIYQPDQRWLKSPDAALTLTRARAIAATDTDKKHLVFAAAPFVSRKILNDENLKVEFAPLPDSLYRVVRS